LNCVFHVGICYDGGVVVCDLICYAAIPSCNVLQHFHVGMCAQAEPEVFRSLPQPSVGSMASCHKSVFITAAEKPRSLWQSIYGQFYIETVFAKSFTVIK